MTATKRATDTLIMLIVLLLPPGGLIVLGIGVALGSA